jgi:protein-tyrosine phosphatase
MRIVSLTALLLLSGCVYFSKHTVTGACTDDLNSPIRNFCVAKPGAIWQGERPTESDAAWLLTHHVGTVVNLEVFLDDRGAFERVQAPSAEHVTVDYYHVPDFEPVHLLTWSQLDNHVARFLAIMSVAPKPVYLHCLDGIDRSNVLIGAYRVLAEGKTSDAALREMQRFRSPWLRFDEKYIRSLDGRRAAILAKASGLSRHTRPGARIECFQGRCTYSTAGQLTTRAERH